MPLRSVRAGLAVGALAAATLVGLPIQHVALKLGSPAARRIPVLFHRFALGAIGVRRRVVGVPGEARPLLIAANHASWLDIVVLGATAPVSFVAKSEIASWPLFGTFARLQRSIFVDRQRRGATGAVSREMSERLVAGDPIVLFAEGTSNDGVRLLPFRSALIGAARAAIVSGGGEEAFVQPVSIAYTHRNGLPLGRRGRQDVAWYGDLDILPHMWAILRGGAIDVTVSFGAPIRVDAATDRKAVARSAEAEVRRMTAAALRGEV
ncbi:1-acyl-sn-glycerol-3-phosphate acyltransferase [Methylopila jiangsuensis]|uniref:lysophospholipid acyltransferase family protein n=1 Tax=Methylopila jiangsuensis TaxID=586230 RepID=UPI0022F2C7F8|nr:lysophospholipid acyltransferase family protein [Methylopila jiangsuensis]MDR6285282.1 1-acyl-sn-glycerol-3-phosphate acyltransferase [Methylopila jiangsuensis]